MKTSSVVRLSCLSAFLTVILLSSQALAFDGQSRESERSTNETVLATAVVSSISSGGVVTTGVVFAVMSDPITGGITIGVGAIGLTVTAADPQVQLASRELGYHQQMFVEQVREDAIAFVASNGSEPTPLFASVLNKLRPQVAPALGDLELARAFAAISLTATAQ